MRRRVLDHAVLFTDHLGWLAGVAASRGTPAAALGDVRAAFRPELHDFPFALACLDDGQALLDGRS